MLARSKKLQPVAKASDANKLPSEMIMRWWWWWWIYIEREGFPKWFYSLIRPAIPARPENCTVSTCFPTSRCFTQQVNSFVNPSLWCDACLIKPLFCSILLKFVATQKPFRTSISPFMTFKGLFGPPSPGKLAVHMVDGSAGSHFHRKVIWKCVACFSHLEVRLTAKEDK